MKKAIFICGIILLSFAVSAQQSPEKVKPTCTATTAAGNPCKGTILMTDGKCRSHSETTPKCGTTTSAGKPCKMSVKVAGDKCKHHTTK